VVADTSEHSDVTRPRIPAIAVASGSFIYIYRNFRPHYKFTVPAVEIDAQESKIWEALAKCSVEIPEALTQLTTMRCGIHPAIIQGILTSYN
jgi:Bardet-Biedl syndrome 1 protein